MKKVKILTILSFIFIASASGQNCKKFHIYGSCMQEPGKEYKMDRQSRSNVIGYGDKLIYNMVVYADRKYKLIFCTSEEFAPVHYRIKDAFTSGIIYDNKLDDYAESVTFNNNYTRKILIELEVLAKDATDEVKLSFLGCSGVLIFYTEQDTR